VIKSFEKELRSIDKLKKSKLLKAEDANFYLPIGEYVLEIESASGIVSKESFMVKDPKGKKESPAASVPEWD
jgi:hypothetical protein